MPPASAAEFFRKAEKLFKNHFALQNDSASGKKDASVATDSASINL